MRRLREFVRAHVRPDPCPRSPAARMRDARATLRVLRRTTYRDPRTYEPFWWSTPGLVAELYARGRLPAIAGGAGTNELIVSGKWATAGNWSLGHKPTAAEDAYIPKGKEVKIEAAAECRSLYGEGNCKITGTLELKIGNAEKPEGPAGASWALKIDPEATITAWTSTVILLSTAAEAQKVSVGPAAKWLELRVKEKSTAKYQLEAGLTLVENGLKLQAETSFDTNGFAWSTTKLTTGAAAKIALKLGTSTVTVTGNLWEAPGAESTVTASSSTIVLAGTSGIFAGGGFSYGTMTVTGMKWTISANNAIVTLNLNNKGAAVGEGFRLSKGMNLTVTTLTSNGTEASPARLETDEAGKSATLTIGEQELTSWLKLKDITVPVGVWYLPKGTDEGGNVTVGTTIKFEAKPGGGAVVGKATGTLVLGGTGTATIRSVVSGKATGPLLLTGASTATVRSVVAGKATGTLLLTGASTGTLRAVVAGKAAGVLLLTGTSTGGPRSVIAGKATGTFVLTGTAAASLASNVTGHATGRLTLTGQAHSSNVVFLPSSPGIVAPRETAGLSNPNQTGGRSGLVAPRQLAGTVTPTQRRGNA